MLAGDFNARRGKANDFIAVDSVILYLVITFYHHLSVYLVDRTSTITLMMMENIYLNFVNLVI